MESQSQRTEAFVVLRWFMLLGAVMLFLGLLLLIVVCLHVWYKSKSSSHTNSFVIPVGMASIGMVLGLSFEGGLDGWRS